MIEKVKRTAYPQEVAEALGISVDTVSRYAREGIIPFDSTPKGHRRYNVDEVREVLEALRAPFDASRLRRSPYAAAPGLGVGRQVRRSAAARLQEELRATRTTAADAVEVEDDEVSVLDDMIEHARRIVISA
jgi:DNA-binding transcriptional MerR regulator